MENRGKVIEKESDAFSRRAWRIPNSDWQLINTASRHSRGQLARYRNAIFIARARARAPTHTHAHTPSMHETAPATSKLPAISRKSISPVACNFTRRDFSLNASSLFPLHLTRSASSPSSNAQTPPRSLSLSLSPRFSICRRVFSHGRNAGLVTYSPRACKRGELSANRKSSFPPPKYTPSKPFCAPFLRGYFSDFSFPSLSLSPSGFRFITPREETRDDEVRDRGETVKSISTEGMSGEEGRVGGGFGSRGIGFPRGDPFSRRGSFARLKWSEIGRRQSDWEEDFWKKTRLGVHFLAHTRLVTGGTNFPGLRTGREARLRGRNSMEEDFEECSSFKGWG